MEGRRRPRRSDRLADPPGRPGLHRRHRRSTAAPASSSTLTAIQQSSSSPRAARSPWRSRPPTLNPRRRRAAGVSLPSWDRFEPRASSTRHESCRPASPCCRSRRHHVRLVAVRRRLDRHRPVRRQRTGERSSSAWVSTWTTSCDAPAAAGGQPRGKDDHGTTDPALRGVRAEPVARQPEARVPHVRPAGPSPGDDGHPRPDVEPDDLPEGDPGSADYDAQFVSSPRRRPDRRRLLDAGHRRHRGGLEVFAPLYDSSHGGDGFVSVEVDPDLAHDSAGTETRRGLHERINRPNLMVKIPGTAEGVAPIRQMISEGRNINVTLIFSLERYQEVMDAYSEGIEQVRRCGATIRRRSPASPASSSRGSTPRSTGAWTRSARPRRWRSVARRSGPGQARLPAVPSESSPARWERSPPTAPGAAPLWASTSTKNPAYPGHDVRRRADRPGHGQHAARCDDRGVRRPRHAGSRVDADVEQAEEVWHQLDEVGIDLADVADRLEREGVSSFPKSFDELLSALHCQVGRAAWRLRPRSTTNCRPTPTTSRLARQLVARRPTWRPRAARELVERPVC